MVNSKESYFSEHKEGNISKVYNKFFNKNDIKNHYNKKDETTENYKYYVPLSNEYYKKVNTINFNSLSNIITFFKDLKSKNSLKNEKTKKIKKNKNLSIFDSNFIVEDNKFIYYLKKMKFLYNYTNKSLINKFILDTSKNLRDRCNRNKALIFNKKIYAAENTKNKLKLNIKSNSSELNIEFIKITQKDIKKDKFVDFDQSDFEYAVYKFGEDLNSIKSFMNMPINDVVNIYYKKFHYFYSADKNGFYSINNYVYHKITNSLCKTIAEREWCDEDKKTFEECFLKYDKKYENYFTYNFVDRKTELDFKIYYIYYNNEILLKKWNEIDIKKFISFYKIFKKDFKFYTNDFYLNNNYDDIKNIIKPLDKNIYEVKKFYNFFYPKIKDLTFSMPYEDFLKTEEINAAFDIYKNNEKLKGKKKSI